MPPNEAIDHNGSAKQIPISNYRRSRVHSPEYYVCVFERPDPKHAFVLIPNIVWTYKKQEGIAGF